MNYPLQVSWLISSILNYRCLETMERKAAASFFMKQKVMVFVQQSNKKQKYQKNIEILEEMKILCKELISFVPMPQFDASRRPKIPDVRFPKYFKNKIDWKVTVPTQKNLLPNLPPTKGWKTYINNNTLYKYNNDSLETQTANSNTFMHGGMKRRNSTASNDGMLFLYFFFIFYFFLSNYMFFGLCCVFLCVFFLL